MHGAMKGMAQLPNQRCWRKPHRMSKNKTPEQAIPLGMEKPAERSADFLDEASALTDTLTRAAIVAASIAACRKEFHADFDGVHCVECGDPIPEKRLAAGRVRCTACQSLLEDTEKRKSSLQGSTGAWTPSWAD